MKSILLLFGAILGATLNVFAQIQGDVLDPKDKGVTNAIITATDSASKTVDTVKVDKRGFYEFTGLKPGTYTIEARAPGFRSAIRKNIEITKEYTGSIQGEEDLYRGLRIDFVLTPAKIP